MSTPSVSNNTFPNELMLRVFSFLPLKDLGRAAKVCKEWRTLAYDNSLWKAIEKRLPRLYPSLSVIDRSVWETHVNLEALALDINDPLLQEEVQPFSKRETLIPIIKAIKEITPLVEGNAGVTLLTIPKELTFNKLKTLSQFPKQGNEAYIAVSWEHVPQDVEGMLVNKTYNVLITNSILKGTRWLSDGEQQVYVNELGFDMPSALEVSALSVVEYIRSEKIIFPEFNVNNDKIPTFTRCLERAGPFKVIAGDVDDCGFFVRNDSNLPGAVIGIGAVKRF